MLRTRRTAVVPALLAGGLLVAASCAPAAPTTPPIRVAKPRTGTTHLSVPRAEADGLTRFDSWPKACDLLTVKDVTAVLPQITKIEQTPREQRITVTNLGDEADDDRDAPDTACETRFWVTGTEKKRRAQPDVVRVEDIAVGDTDTVKDNYDELAGSRPRIPGGLGALECVRTDAEYDCRTGHVAFAVSAAPSLYIDRFVGQPKKTETRWYWVDTVLPEFVRAVAAKLP
jgi:hypothetical protein